MKIDKKRARLAVAISASILAGFGAVAGLSRGIEYVVAADIHPMVNDPQKPAAGPQNRSARGVAGLAQEAAPSAPQAKVLGECTTKFSPEPKGRNVNIAKAADSLKGVVVKPGEVFSYNDTIGPTTKENGYQRARIFVRGKKSYGYGGGVCQVSSTLFNAVESAGMEVVERHGHSLPVEYVPKGKDAATSYGSIDFKFKNTLSQPVKIDTGIAENALTIQIVPEG